MQHFHAAALVDIVHKALNTAFIAHGFAHRFLAPAVGEGDAHAGIEEGLFPQTGEQGFIVIEGGFKDGGIGSKGDSGTAFISGTGIIEVTGGLAVFKALFPAPSVPAHLDFQPGGQGIYHRSAHAMQTAGHLVSAAAELTAGMEYGEYNSDCGNSQFGLDIHRDTTAVIPDPDHIVGQQFHFDMGTEPRQSLVDGIVHDLIDQMVQALGTGGTDIHARALADGFQAFQDLDLTAVILFADRFVFHR